MNIDLKKCIIDIIRNITMAENATIAGKDPNSQLCTNNTQAEKQLSRNIKYALTDNQLLIVIKSNLLAQQQPPNKVIKEEKLRFLKEKKI